ncbi:MAG: electron transport complex subunit RsxC [Lachnospiraceae bacterium]
MIWKFKGGIHPKDGKALSKDKPIKPYRPKGEMVFPLVQHIGAPAKPVVAKGDHVLAGQLIAEAGGFISANIHSSVSGEVKAIEPRRVPNGDKVMSIIIENDQQYEEVEYHKVDSIDSLSNDEIIERVKAAGIVGMGGAGFPTHVKLMPKNPEQIEYVIINGAECEPYLTSDYRRMLEQPMRLVEGLKVSLRLFPNAKGIIGIEANKPDAVALMEGIVANEERITVKKIPARYPQGAERMLIYATTGRKINSSMLPADAGCVVHNVDSVGAIYDAVVEGRPLISRIVTVTGDTVKEPQNFIVPIGTNTRELIEAAGGLTVEPEKVVSGGPMMGIALFDMDIPITKGSSSILTFEQDDVCHVKPSNCINCGRCVSVCPERLLPTRLAQLALHGDTEGFQANYGMECCECGSCTYVCPAKRNLAQEIKTMRKEILASRKK